MATSAGSSGWGTLPESIMAGVSRLTELRTSTGAFWYPNPFNGASALGGVSCILGFLLVRDPTFKHVGASVKMQFYCGSSQRDWRQMDGLVEKPGQHTRTKSGSSQDLAFGAFCLDVRTLNFLPTNEFSVLNHQKFRFTINRCLWLHLADRRGQRIEQACD